MPEHIADGPPPGAETDTQYRVVYSDDDTEMVEDLEDARDLAYDHGGRVQRRTITYGPWEDAPDEH